MTISQTITELRRDAYKLTDAHQASEILVKLSSLLGNASDEWIVAEMNYNRVYESATNVLEKVTEARAKAKATVEYEQKLIKEAQLETIRELINSIKYLIKVKMSEELESRHQ